MAVTYDAVSHAPATAGALNTASASFNWTHTTGSSPKGVIVFTFCVDIYSSTTDRVTSVTYGGTSLTAVPSGRAVASVDGNVVRDVKAWYLGTSVPSGNQTVVVNRTNNGSGIYATAVTFNAAIDTSVTGTILAQSDTSSLSQVNVDDGSPGADSLRLGAINADTTSGVGSGFLHINGMAKYVSNNILAGGNSVWIAGTANNAGVATGIRAAFLTSLYNEILESNVPANSNMGVVRETSNGQGSRPVGFSGSYTALPPAPASVAALYLAVKEGAAASLEPAKLPIVISNRAVNFLGAFGQGVLKPF